jgi:hypothetical protein
VSLSLFVDFEDQRARPHSRRRPDPYRRKPAIAPIATSQTASSRSSAAPDRVRPSWNRPGPLLARRRHATPTPKGLSGASSKSPLIQAPSAWRTDRRMTAWRKRDRRGIRNVNLASARNTAGKRTKIPSSIVRLGGGSSPPHEIQIGSGADTSVSARVADGVGLPLITCLRHSAQIEEQQARWRATCRCPPLMLTRSPRIRSDRPSLARLETQRSAATSSGCTQPGRSRDPR